MAERTGRGQAARRDGSAGRRRAWNGRRRRYRLVGRTLPLPHTLLTHCDNAVASAQHLTHFWSPSSIRLRFASFPTRRRRTSQYPQYYRYLSATPSNLVRVRNRDEGLVGKRFAVD